MDLATTSLEIPRAQNERVRKSWTASTSMRRRSAVTEYEPRARSEYSIVTSHITSAPSRQRPRQAGRAPSALQADLPPLIFENGGSGAFQRGACPPISAHHDTHPRRRRQHVRPQRPVLFVRNVDEPVAAANKLPAKRQRHQAGIHDGKVCVDRA